MEVFMNNTVGLRAFFENAKGHETVAKCLDDEKPQVMIQALKVRYSLYQIMSLYSIFNFKM